MTLDELKHNIAYWRSHGFIGPIVPYEALDTLIAIAEAVTELEDDLVVRYRGDCAACGEWVAGPNAGQHDDDCPWERLKALREKQ